MATLASGTKAFVVIAEETTAYTTETVPAQSAVAVSTIESDANSLITVTTSVSHGYTTGDRVTFAIDPADAQAVLNGNDYYVDVKTASTFNLYGDRKLRKYSEDLGASEVGVLTNSPTVTRKSLEAGYEAPRVTSRAVNLEKNLLESEEVRQSRMQRDVRHGFTTASASIGFEWVPGGQEVLFDAVLDAITAETAVASAITVTGAVLAGTTGPGNIEVVDGDADSIKVGDLLVFFRNATGVLLGSAVVLAVDTTGGSPDTILIGDRSVLAGQSSNTADFVVAKKNEIGNGAFKTYTIERQFTDLDTPQYEPFYGMVGNSLNVTISPEAIAGGTTEFVGTGSGSMGSTSQNGAAAAHPTSESSPFAAFDGAIFESGADNDLATATPLGLVTSIEFTVNNNRTSEARIGSKFSPCVFDATCQVEGTMSVFFEDKTLYDKFVDETTTEIIIHLTGADASQRTYASVYFPRVKFNGGTIDPPAEGAVTLEIPFRALEGLAGESAVTISTFDSAVGSIDV